MNNASFEYFPAENHLLFPAPEPRKNLKFRRIFLKTGLTKKQKVTKVYYNAKDPLAEIHTHDTGLKKRLISYAAKHPELCKQVDDDGRGGLWFEIDKRRVSIRLTAPYSQERRETARRLAEKTNTFRNSSKK